MSITTSLFRSAIRRRVPSRNPFSKRRKGPPSRIFHKQIGFPPWAAIDPPRHPEIHLKAGGQQAGQRFAEIRSMSMSKRTSHHNTEAHTTHTYIHISYIYISIYLYIYIYVYISKFIYIYINKTMYTHTYIYIHTKNPK